MGHSIQCTEVAYVSEPCGFLQNAPDAAWLHSHAPVPGSAARFSICGLNPAAVIEQPWDGPAVFRVGDRIADQDPSVWVLLKRVSQQLRVERSTQARCLDGYGPGWIGYIGYEAARQLERLPGRQSDDFGLPLARLMLYQHVVIADHACRRAWLTSAGGLDEAIGAAETSLDSMEECWNTAAGIRSAAAAPIDEQSHAAPLLVSALQREQHERIVARALEYIGAGDVYQVNLAHRIKLDGVKVGYDTFSRLVERTQPPFAAWMRWDDCAVLSASPELFLKSRSGRLTTRPIKGTRARHADPATDADLRRALLDSAKDKAELAMIIDLHRNDLGRVSEYGSVAVRESRRLEIHPTLFHTVGEIEAKLRRTYTALDAAAALFPAGSITGAPKIRAMQIIDELETAPRNVYTGAIGHIGLDGDLTLNVAIRTAQCRGDQAVMHVGGGIVADSDPAEEFEETLTKARGIVDALHPGPATSKMASTSTADASYIQPRA